MRLRGAFRSIRKCGRMYVDCRSNIHLERKLHPKNGIKCLRASTVSPRMLKTTSSTFVSGQSSTSWNVLGFRDGLMGERRNQITGQLWVGYRIVMTLRWGGHHGATSS